MKEWLLGTVGGVILLGLAVNLFTDGIHLSWNALIKKILGGKGGFQVLGEDGKPIGKRTLAAVRTDFPNALNGARFDLILENGGEEIVGPIFVDWHLPPTMKISPSITLLPPNREGFVGIESWILETEAFSIPGKGRRRAGFFFCVGKDVPRLSGTHTLGMIIRTTKTMLFDGEVRVKIKPLKSASKAS